MRGRRRSVACGAAVLLSVHCGVAAAGQPVSAAGLLVEYFALSREAEAVNEQVLAAEEGRADAQAASAVAVALLDDALTRWQRQQADFAQHAVDTIDALVDHTFTVMVGGKGDNPAAVLSRYVAAQQELAATWSDVDGAGRDATAARDALARSQRQLDQRRTELAGRINEVKAAIDRLPAGQRDLLSAGQDDGAVPALAGAAGTALAFALAQRGKPYVWGAEGPDSYDCSGLVQTAYATAGVRLPRVAVDQSRVGAAVSRADVRAGDLVFFSVPVTHVAMAVDNQRAVHAATFGQPVKIDRIDAIGPIAVIRRPWSAS